MFSDSPLRTNYETKVILSVINKARGQCASNVCGVLIVGKRVRIERFCEQLIRSTVGARRRATLYIAAREQIAACVILVNRLLIACRVHLSDARQIACRVVVVTCLLALPTNRRSLQRLQPS